MGKEFGSQLSGDKLEQYVKDLDAPIIPKVFKSKEQEKLEKEINEVYQKAHNKRQEYSNKIEVISEQVADNNEILKTEVAWLDSTYKDLQKRITDFNNTTWQSKAQAEAAQEKINEDLKAFTKRHEEYLDLSNDQQARIHLAKKIYE